MIDGIKPLVFSVSDTPSGDGAQAQENEMSLTLEELKAKHPAIYKAAFEEGVAEERDRVTAHLIMGEKAAAMDIATKAIKEGQGMTMTLQSEYMTAGMNRSDVGARQEDDDVNDPGTPQGQMEDAVADQVAELVCKRMGVDD